MKNFKMRIQIEATDQLEDEQIEYLSKKERAMPLFHIWLQAFRKTQRPIWVDTLIENCYICEKQFSYFNR